VYNAAITYCQTSPCEKLKGYINAYWHFSIQPSRKTFFEILPDGCFDLIIVVRENSIVNTSLTGIWSRKIDVEYTQNADVYGIRFTPLAIGTIFPFSISEYINSSIQFPLETIHGNSIELLEHIKLKTLSNYFDRLLISMLQNKKADLYFTHAYTLVLSSCGLMPVSEICNAVGISARQLQRKCNDAIGIGMKEYSSIIRLKQTLKNIKSKTFDHNYYDQSHLIKEMKKHIGYTPKKLDLQDVRFLQYSTKENI